MKKMWLKILSPLTIVVIFNSKKNLNPYEITLSLTPNQWQQLAENCSNLDVVEQISEYIELDTSAWIGVDSSCIDAIQYNNLTSTLLIRKEERLHLSI